MQYRNPRMLADGRIDCEIDHPKHGWIPYTADANDDRESGRMIHAEILAAGTAAPYVADPAAELAAWRAAAVCSPLQGQLALGEARWAQVEAILDDPETPWATRQTVRAAQSWRRNSATIALLAGLLGLTEAEVDDLFRTAITINV